MRLKLGVLLGSLIAVGLIAAGCGGDDDDGNGGGGEALTKEEFVAETQKICDENKAKAEEVLSQAQTEAQANPQNLQQVFADTVEALIPTLRDTVNRIGELTPPEDLQDTLDEFVSGANEAFDEIESDPQAFFQRASTGEEPFPELQQQSRELGIPEDCLGTGESEETGTTTAPSTTP
jgi:hypothetical protein